MKKVFIILLSVLMFSCATQKTQVDFVSGESFLMGYDFTPYSNKGFLISPEMYQGNYDAIGLLDYVLMPEANRKMKIIGARRDAAGNIEYEKQYTWNVESIDVAAAIDSMYVRCVNMGADAIVNFKVNVEEKNYLNYSPSLFVTGYRISGFAIKRK